GRAGPDAVVQVAAQVPELGPDLRLRPAGHLPADTLTALVTEGHSGHPIVVRLVVVDRVFAMAASRPGFSHVSMILVWLLPESWLFGPIRSQLLYLRKSGGRNWVRTSDPSLVRRARSVALRRPVWSEVPASWTNRRCTSPSVARSLSPLGSPFGSPGF